MGEKGECGKRKQMPALLCHMVYVCEGDRMCLLLHLCVCSCLLALSVSVEACCHTPYW